ncbi:hypothetical protein [Pseudoalteromonas mariniglutinosa]|uniref:hypothetical protein n=1 Tax=Pseudoalteromonas mariniglutinosa TaxID=206042 RepID=UPI00384C16D8
MIFVGQCIVFKSKASTSQNSKETLIRWRVCHVNFHLKKAAVSDMCISEVADNISKPKAFSFNELYKRIKLASEVSSYDLPAEMSYSDKELVRIGRQTWIDKRDYKYQKLAPLTTESVINQYLYGKTSISKEIDELILSEKMAKDKDKDEGKGKRWLTRGVYYNALNRYIVFGCSINALLPTKLKNTGSNYFLPAAPGEDNVKRGRGRADNSKSLSKSIGVTQQHKEQFKQVLAFLNSKEGKKKFASFSYKKAVELYQYNFETSVVVREIDGIEVETRIPFEEQYCLSEEQITYHLKKLIDKKLYVEIRYGNIVYEKDYAARQGAAHDGVIGATHRYEIDATVIDSYVRYPFDVSGQYSMGRPVLYIVIDVYSTMIMGFYIGFDGPNWQGACQALINACSCKVKYAESIGLTIREEDFPSHHMPYQITVDNGNEHPDRVITSVLQSEVGVLGYNFTAVFRGDAKGTVESKFNTLNDTTIHFTPGAITKDLGRGEQHPSNQALLDYDSLRIEIFQTIMLVNNTADRLHRHDINAIRNNIDITPKALFVHSLKQEMNGGRDAKLIERGKIYWAFLPEETATVRADGIYFKGLVYYSDYAKKANWFSKAKHDKAFKIPVKRYKAWTNTIYHKTQDGQYIRFDLKNVNDESPFINQHWEPVLHLLEQFKDKRHKNRLNAKKLRIFKENLSQQLLKLNEQQISDAPENTRTSIQPGVKERQLQFKAIHQLMHQIELYENLSGSNQAESETYINHNQYDDLDEEMN